MTQKQLYSDSDLGFKVLTWNLSIALYFTLFRFSSSRLPALTGAPFSRFSKPDRCDSSPFTMWLSRARRPLEDDAGSAVGEESESPAASARQQPAARCWPSAADSLPFLLVSIVAPALHTAILLPVRTGLCWEHFSSQCLSVRNVWSLWSIRTDKIWWKNSWIKTPVMWRWDQAHCCCRLSPVGGAQLNQGWSDCP